MAESTEWQSVANTVGGQGSTWQVTPKGSPWRNGQAERMVGLAKTSLSKILGGQNFKGDFHAFESLFTRISWLLNSQPIAVQNLSETDIHLISPNDILLGRAARHRGEIPSQEELEETDAAIRSLSYMEKVAREWHKSFMKQVWPLLVPHRRWRDERDNVAIGDIGFLLYTSKFDKPTWRPCRVEDLHPDQHGVVRTVTVVAPRRTKSTEDKPLVMSKLSQLTVAVQRVAITLPVNEQSKFPIIQSVL